MYCRYVGNLPRLCAVPLNDISMIFWSSKTCISFHHIKIWYSYFIISLVNECGAGFVLLFLKMESGTHYMYTNGVFKGDALLLTNCFSLLYICMSIYIVSLLFNRNMRLSYMNYSVLLPWGRGEGAGGEVGNFGVILVRVCEPVFQNLPHSYTWPLKKTDPFIYLIIQNVDLFKYCPLIFCTHFCWLLDKYHSQFM